MERISITEASHQLNALVDRVSDEGIIIELERDHEPIACLSPLRSKKPLMACDLNAFFASLPSLGDDAEAFARDVEEARKSFPPEADPWE